MKWFLLAFLGALTIYGGISYFVHNGCSFYNFAIAVVLVGLLMMIIGIAKDRSGKILYH